MPANASTPEDGKRGSLTDSPWYWLGLFGTAALVALVVIGPKFERRQQRLELQSDVRERIWRERVEEPAPDTAVEEKSDAGDDIAARRTRNVLWPVIAVVFLVTCLAWGKLYLDRTRQQASP